MTHKFPDRDHSMVEIMLQDESPLAVLSKKAILCALNKCGLNFK